MSGNVYRLNLRCHEQGGGFLRLIVRTITWFTPSPLATARAILVAHPNLPFTEFAGSLLSQSTRRKPIEPVDATRAKESSVASEAVI